LYLRRRILPNLLHGLLLIRAVARAVCPSLLLEFAAGQCNAKDDPVSPQTNEFVRLPRSHLLGPKSFSPLQIKIQLKSSLS